MSLPITENVPVNNSSLPSKLETLYSNGLRSLKQQGSDTMAPDNSSELALNPPCPTKKCLVDPGTRTTAQRSRLTMETQSEPSPSASRKTPSFT